MIQLSEQKISKRKQQILKVAEALFKNKGFAASSMRDLAKAVGVEAASLYSHIQSKQEILQHICFNVANSFFTAQQNLNDHKISPSEKLKLAIANHVDVVLADKDAFLVYLNEWKFIEEPQLSEFKELLKTYEGIFIAIIEEGTGQWNFKHIDEQFVCTTLLSALNWIPNWYKSDGKWSKAEIVEKISNLFLLGIKQ